jgi:hypothetical protein
MAFDVKDLMDKIQAAERGGGWVVVVGCGPASVECPSTQPQGLVNQDPIDFVNGPESFANLLYLRQALAAKMEQIKVEKVQTMSSEERERFEDAERRLVEAPVAELLPEDEHFGTLKAKARELAICKP